MESIVYAVDWNQVRENVLGGAAWLGGSGAEVIEQLRKPTAMVCSTKGAERNPLAGGRKKRDELLVDMIRSAVAKGGTVLIPTDTSARVLELAYILEHTWRQAWRKESRESGKDSTLRDAKLYLASKTAGATMTYARSMLEWMDENVVREFENEASNNQNQQHKRTNSKQVSDNERNQAGKPSGPFDFQYLKLLERKSQVEKIISAKGPRVILASDSSLQWGFSKQVLQRIAAQPSNLIVLTKDYGTVSEANEAKSSLGRTLWQWYQERQDGIAMETAPDGQNLEQVHTGGRELHLNVAERIPLAGNELLMYQQYLATQRRLQNTMPTSDGKTLETAADALDEASSTSSSSSEASDPERQGKSLNTSAVVAQFNNRNKLGQNKETLGVNALLRQPRVYDYDVRGKKGREQMFPFLSKRRRADDFGDLINPDDYLRAEERDDTNGQGLRDNEDGKETRLGQKRKWQDSGMQNSAGRRGSEGSNKRRQTMQDPRRRNQANGDAEANGAAAAEDSLSDESDTDVEETAVGPFKVRFETTVVETHSKIGFVDFSGLHDQRSLSMLIPLIQPKKLILVGGSLSETNYLANDCRQKLRPADGAGEASIYTPADGETVNASVDTNAWTVKLSEALVRRFHWQDVKGMGVVTLVGHLAATALEDESQTEATRKKQKLMKKDPQNSPRADEIASPTVKPPELAPLLDVLPASMAAATRSVAQPLHVGDLRLADLRKILQAGGHTAEFRGEGTLLIDGLVAVRKSGTGKIEVEGGGLSLPDLRSRTHEGSFFAVKRRIYEGLAVIAGG
jgi:cleavage and polyadenylation specificity factor subunit 2